ncbi:methyltransferase [Spirillospora sp. CA-294931]|uniref:methyltransferase n=1 Tax=Spirillospora sp. CA-294931 TaxID=3240042 RepID=UPI003D93AE48
MIDLGTPFAVRAAVTLRLPELIGAGVVRVGELVARTGADPDALRRLLSHLVRVGLFDEVEPGVYGLNAVSELLPAHTLRDWLDLDGPGLKIDLTYSGIMHSLRTGEPAYGEVHGRAFWDEVAVDPAFGSMVNGVMATATARENAPQLATEYDWSGVRTVVDVGGGLGVQLAEVLRAHPHLRGILVDLPPTASAAERVLAEAGVAERAEVRPGSFFDELPAGADVYLVSRVLTDWDDEKAAKILERCARAVAPGGQVLILEVLPSPERDRLRSSFDLQMLLLIGGRERTVADFGELAARAGLALTSSRIFDNGLTLIECDRKDR